ncbi:uncharacterized protein TNCV_3075421 [Trichonephila clavipes]|nr:uncharacterized protein TNCV_3075421 [Trichonephila clavipes]
MRHAAWNGLDKESITRARYANLQKTKEVRKIKDLKELYKRSHPSDSKLCQKWKYEKQIQEIKTNKNVSYFEARKLIVPRLIQTYAQATKPSSISTATQTDPNIICPPFQYLKPLSSENAMPSTSSSVSTVSTPCSSNQENLLPSRSAIIPTIQKVSVKNTQSYYYYNYFPWQ